MSDPRDPSSTIGLKDLCLLFLKLGFTFGAGTGMSAQLQRELVDKYHATTRAEFMAVYGLARVVPSGSMTAIAVAYGYRFAGIPGTVVVLLAMILPAFVLTVLLTIAYTLLVSSPAFGMLNLTLMPAALAVVIVAAYRLAQEFLSPSVELLLCVLAFVAVIVLGVSPALLLISGGVLGALAIRDRGDD